MRGYYLFENNITIIKDIPVTAFVTIIKSSIINN